MCRSELWNPVRRFPLKGDRSSCMHLQLNYTSFILSFIPLCRSFLSFPSTLLYFSFSQSQSFNSTVASTILSTAQNQRSGVLVISKKDHPSKPITDGGEGRRNYIHFKHKKRGRINSTLGPPRIIYIPRENIHIYIYIY